MLDLADLNAIKRISICERRRPVVNFSREIRVRKFDGRLL